MIQWAVTFGVCIHFEVMCVMFECGRGISDSRKARFLTEHHRDGVRTWSVYLPSDAFEESPCVADILYGWYGPVGFRVLVSECFGLVNSDELLVLLMEKYGEKSKTVQRVRRSLGVKKLPFSLRSMMRSANILMSLQHCH